MIVLSAVLVKFRQVSVQIVNAPRIAYERDRFRKNVVQLVKIIGPERVAYIGGAEDDGMVRQWKKGVAAPKSTQQSIAVALKAAKIIMKSENGTAPTVAAWLDGPTHNFDSLCYRLSASDMLSMSATRKQEKQIIAAAKKFVSCQCAI
jgi:hypothetical protein